MQNLCPFSRPTPLAGYGGFAHSLRVDHRFAISVPEALESVNAAPLLCAGITVYAPLKRLVRPGTRVGVIGVGGLGHLALQFADKWGCEVTAFTSDLSKTDELKALGADFVVNSRSDEELEKLKGKFDLIACPEGSRIIRRSDRLTPMAASSPT